MMVIYKYRQFTAINYSCEAANYDDAWQEYESMGFEPAFQCKISGTSLVYFDTVNTLGHFTELWQRSDAFIDFMNFVKDASVDWDGNDPVRDASI